MDVFEAIKKRRSIRSYKNKPIEEEKLMRILEGVRLAPSASNRQNWKFVVVKDDKIKKAVAKASGQPFLAEASVIIAGCATETSHVMMCGIPSYIVDVSLALEHIALQAVEEGLGTCWIGHFDQEKVKEILELPKAAKIVELLLLGYPDERPSAHNRKDPDEIVSYNKW